jgi:hypothetical protein
MRRFKAPSGIDCASTGSAFGPDDAERFGVSRHEASEPYLGTILPPISCAFAMLGLSGSAPTASATTLA